MRCYVEVVGSGTCDVSFSIQLFFFDGRYVFELGDGALGVYTEYGMILTTLRGTYPSSQKHCLWEDCSRVVNGAWYGWTRISTFWPEDLSGLFLAVRTFSYHSPFSNPLTEIDLRTPRWHKPILLLMMVLWNYRLSLWTHDLILKLTIDLGFIVILRPTYVGFTISEKNSTLESSRTWSSKRG